MQNYIMRRVLLLIPTIILVTIIVFFLVRFIPGDVIDVMMAEQQAFGHTEIDRDELVKRLGLDVPIFIQYGRWVAEIFRGNLGDSLWSSESVVEALRTRLPVSLELGLIAIIIGQLVAIPIGILSAIRQDTPQDYVGRILAILFLCLPNFWLGTLVMVYPSIWWHWAPPLQYIPLAQDPLGNLGMFIIPGAIMGLHASGSSMRMTRTMMLEVMRQDYIRTAWSKGLSEKVVIIRHALKNALIPVVTMIGISLPVVIAGTVIMENIFALPGMGRLTLEALTKRDYAMVSGINLFFAGFVMLVNLGVDLSYAFLDPRIHYK